MPEQIVPKMRRGETERNTQLEGTGTVSSSDTKQLTPKLEKDILYPPPDKGAVVSRCVPGASCGANALNGNRLSAGFPGLIIKPGGRDNPFKVIGAN